MDLLKALWQHRKQVTLLVLLGLVVFIIVWALLNTVFTLQRRASEPVAQSCGQECYRCQLDTNAKPVYPYKLTFQAGSDEVKEISPYTLTVNGPTDPNYIERCFDPSGGVILTTCTSEILNTQQTGGGDQCTYTSTISVLPQQCQPTPTGPVTPEACACDKDGGTLTCDESFSADEGIIKWKIQWNQSTQQPSGACSEQFQCDHVNLYSSKNQSTPYATIAPCPPASSPAEVRVHQAFGNADREYKAIAVNPKNTPMPECKTCNTKFSCPADCSGKVVEVVSGQCDDGCNFSLSKACSNIGDQVRASLVGPSQGYEYWINWDDIDNPNPEQFSKTFAPLSHSYDDGGVYDIKLECKGIPNIDPCVKRMTVMCGGGETPTDSPTPTPEACIPLEFVPLETVCQEGQSCQ